MPTPILIAADYGASGNAPQPRNIFGPISIAGVLWIILGDNNTTTIDAFKSTDGGQTWTQVSSGPNVGYIFAAQSDGATGITVAIGSQDIGSFHLYTFDTVAQTWSSAFASSGAQLADSFNTLLRRSDGSYVLLFVAYPPVAGVLKPKYGVWDGVAWSFAALTTNAPAGVFETDFVNGVVDSNDLVHTFRNLNNGASAAFAYQAIKPDNSLGNFANFTNVAFPTIASFSETGVASVSNTFDFLFFPVTINLAGFPNNGFPAALIGTPRTAPVWSLTGKLSLQQINQLDAPSSQIIGESQIRIAGLNTANTAILLIASSAMAAPSTGWADLTPQPYAPLTQIFDYGISNDPTFKPNMILDGLHVGISQAAYSFLVSNTPPPPPPPVPTTIAGPMVGGVPIAGIWALPNAAVKCDVDGRKKCVIVKDLRPMQRSVK